MSAQGRPKGERPEARSAEGSQVSVQGGSKDDFVPERGAQGTIR